MKSRVVNNIGAAVVLTMLCFCGGSPSAAACYSSSSRIFFFDVLGHVRNALDGLMGYSL
jgi:hypothetical protein